MKKRFFNGFLAVAMLIASVGTFVSCKDHEEDNYSDLKAQLAEQDATLRELINVQIANMQSQIKKLEEAQLACKQECAAKFAEFKAFVADTYETKEHANAAYDKLANEIAALKTADAQLSLAIENLKKTTNEAIDKLGGRIDEANSRIDEALRLISDLQTALNQANALAQSAYDLATQANALAGQANSTAQTALEKALKNEEIISLWTPKWEETMKKAADALAKALENEQKIENLIKANEEFEANDAAMSTRIDSIVNALKDLQISQDLTSVREMVEKAYNDAVSYTDTQIAAVEAQIATLDSELGDLESDVEDLAEKVNGLELKIGELKTAYEEADKKLADEIKAVADSVAALEERVKANEVAIETLTGEIEEIWNALKSQVTGIVLQGTYSPIIGSFALPLDIRTNILAGYYGEAGSEGLEFPTARPKYYVNPDNVILTSADLNILGSIETTKNESGESLFGEDGNAGTLYLTINPNTVDFTGITLPLVNSLDEQSGLVLSPLKKSSHKLTFGYMRADNGFYEAKATINESSLSSIKTISIENFKDIASNVKENGVSVSTIANALYDALSELDMDANAVKATWNDGTQDHSIYSQYGIAALAIKPLGFSFGSDFNYSVNIPGLESAEKLVGRILDKIKIDLPDFDIDMHSFEIKDLEIKELDDAELAANFKVDIIDKNGNVTQTVDFTQGIKEIYGDATAPLDDVNQLLADLRLYIDDVNDLIEQLKRVGEVEDDIENIKGDIKSELTKYFDVFNDKFSNLINSINKALRPVLLVKTESGYHKLSQSVSIPTRIDGTEFIILPTSYTAEYLAPAYKKFIAVTNVYTTDRSANAQGGDADCLSVLKAANEQTNYATVLNGSKQLLDFSGQKGYIYEIVYTAADFYGYVDAKKFYVTVE